MLRRHLPPQRCSILMKGPDQFREDTMQEASTNLSVVWLHGWRAGVVGQPTTEICEEFDLPPRLAHLLMGSPPLLC